MSVDVIPSGLVTFMFSDIEGSTRLWASDPTAMSASLQVHDQLIREIVAVHHGFVFTTAGDSFCVAFAEPAMAVESAQEIQASLRAADWPGPPLQVRIGLHRGVAEERDRDYFGPTLNTVGRVAAAGHGGQILLSADVQLATDVPATDLGVQRLRDVPDPIRLYQLGDAAFPALRVVPDTLSSLPIPPTSLVGRDDVVLRIRAELLEHRLVTIAGIGGSGKTRLALEVAEQELPHFAHGAYFVDLASVGDDDGVIAAVADAVRLHSQGGDPLEQLLNYLSDKQALIVLDNCEHVVGACADLAEAMLGRPGDWRIVATSREHLGVAGEQLFKAPPLDVSADGSAVELFADRALAVRPEFSIDDHRDVVADLCRRLDGMPLAIELAAARAGVMVPAEMLERLDDRFRLLSGGRRRLGQRQGTLAATLDWSYELLTDDEQRCFRRLGVFTGPFDVTLASAVADVEQVEALDLLESLVGKSIVTAADEDGRTLFRLLETIRAYALDKLAAQEGELAAARDRQLDQQRRALAAESEATGSWVVWNWNTVRRWLALTPNLGAAIDWAISQERFVDAGEILAAGTPIWREQLTVRANLDRIDAVTAALPADSDLRERLLITEIPSAMALDQHERVGRFLEASSLLRNDTVREFHLVMLANAASMTDPTTSLQLAEQATQLPGDPFVFWDKNRADIHLFAGEYEEAVEVLRPLQGTDLWAVIDGTIAIALLMDGRAEEALDVADDHTMRDSIRMSFGLIVGLCRLALDQEEAATRELMAVARSAALGRMSLRANTALVGIAALVHRRGDVDWAREIILGARCQREVAVNALARGVADDIGVRDEFVALQEAASRDLAAHDRTEFLRETLDRLDALSG